MTKPLEDLLEELKDLHYEQEQIIIEIENLISDNNNYYEGDDE
ncbi:MAG: hypothetical protein ACO239_08795 [Sediminibacterium sp.]